MIVNSNQLTHPLLFPSSSFSIVILSASAKRPFNASSVVSVGMLLTLTNLALVSSENDNY